MQKMMNAYAAARRRNLERIREKRQRHCANMRAAQARKRIEESPVREAPWSPPALRRIIVVIDLDSGRPMMRMMQLWRGDRIDRFRVRSPRGESIASVGWSRILARVRKAYPRTLRLED